MWQAYRTPASLDQALRLLAEYGPEARIIAGGTDLLVELRRGVRWAATLIDITRIDSSLEGRSIPSFHSGQGYGPYRWLGMADTAAQAPDRWIEIGPTCTHNQALASDLLREHGLPLALACGQVGTPQLRNRGTIAGNLVTASPANDTITALWALDAQVMLRSVRGERTLSFAEFFQGVRQTALAPEEMVVAIRFPALRADQRGTFVKLGLRRSHAIALVNAAVVLTLDGDTVREARIALGSVAPTIVRAPLAEHALVGQRLGLEAIAEAAGLAAETAAPIDDIRSSAAYRRDMVGVLVQRALNALRDGAEGAQPGGHASLPGRHGGLPLLWGRGTGEFAPLTGDGLVHERGMPTAVECVVNGQAVTVPGAAGKTLLAMLREDLGLTGSKEGCGEGECGSCTVWMDGMAVLACLVPAPRAHGAQITTIEGLAQSGRLHPVQQAFIDEGAVQCGYCTPGFIMSGANLLEEIPTPTREQIVAGLEGNLCRCTGYYKIVRAIERATHASPLQDPGADPGRL